MTRTCPLCGGGPRGLAFPYETVWNGKAFQYRACGGCGSTFVDPVPTEGELKAIYAWESYHSRHYSEVDRVKYRRTLDLLADRCPGKRSLLDFGCGGGGFLVAAKEAGYDCRGVEYESSTIDKVRELTGVSVTGLEALEEAAPRFDLIRLSDVHPHLPDPATTFRTLERFLAPGGLFLIEGPLENNPSLVYFLSAASKSLRRRVGLDGLATIAPTMLVRVNRKAQRDFFGRRMGYRELYFEVFETGWPFYVTGRPLHRPKERVKQALGALAVALSRADRGPIRLLGNRFVGIYEPKRDCHL